MGASADGRDRPLAWHSAMRGGVRLACRDFGGHGAPVVLLHGLCGYAGEWAETARGLTGTHRVLAPDQRAHGRSERTPGDVSQEAFAGDVAFWLEHLDLAPATIIGQSLGGLTALLVAAHRPDLVERLVVAEATPAADPLAPGALSAWLDGWKRPFASRRDALAFFGDTTSGRTWVRGLERRDGRYGPAFEPEVVIRALGETATTSYWDEWRSIACRALVVRGETGMPAPVVARMLRELPTAHCVTIPDAGHDVHLEQPDRWNAVIQGFV